MVLVDFVWSCTKPKSYETLFTALPIFSQLWPVTLAPWNNEKIQPKCFRIQLTLSSSAVTVSYTPVLL